MGITATAGAKSLSHTVSFGIILAFLTNIAQFTYWKCKPRRGTHWQKNGPLYLTLAAVPLVMADLTRHVLQDAGMWVGPSSSMYDEECCSLHSCRGMHGAGCLTWTGILLTIGCTYTGFFCLMAGVIWAANVPEKVRTFMRTRV